MENNYLTLHLDRGEGPNGETRGYTVQVKIEREGVVLDVWTTEDNPETGHPEEVLVDSTYEFFAEMGMELVPIDEEDL